MAASVEKPDAAALAAGVATYARTIADNPDFVLKVAALVRAELEAAPRLDVGAPAAHVAAHLDAIGPRLLAYPDIGEEAERIAALANDAALPDDALGTESVPGILIGGIGLAIGLIVLGVIEYCLSGPQPEPGTSQPVNC